jgi:hypothetical protein
MISSPRLFIDKAIPAVLYLHNIKERKKKKINGCSSSSARKMDFSFQLAYFLFVQIYRAIENGGLTGQIPRDLFTFPQIQTV